MAIRGLKDIVTKSAEAVEQQAQNSQNRVNYVYLGEGDTALLRFIDDEEMLQTKIHEYEELDPTGKKRYRKAYCSNNLNQIPCKWCAAGNYGKNVYVFLAYLYYIVHKTQNPKLNTDPQATKWEPVKQGTQMLYKENIGEIRLLRIKFGKDGKLKNVILKFVDEYGTLCDRDYRFSRDGSGMHTDYSFVPRDKSDMSEIVIAAKKAAPHIADILIGKPQVVSATKVDESPVANGPTGAEESIEDIF